MYEVPEQLLISLTTIIRDKLFLGGFMLPTT